MHIKSPTTAGSPIDLESVIAVVTFVVVVPRWCQQPQKTSLENRLFLHHKPLVALLLYFYCSNRNAFFPEPFVIYEGRRQTIHFELLLLQPLSSPSSAIKVNKISNENENSCRQSA